MVVIRLSRAGAKKRPFYHIVVTEKRNARDGRFLESIGYFNPIASGKDVPLFLDIAKCEAWIAKGAQPSDRVRNLMKAIKKTAQTTEAA